MRQPRASENPQKEGKTLAMLEAKARIIHGRTKRAVELEVESACIGGEEGAGVDGKRCKFKWAENQEAVTFLGYRPTRS